MFSLNSLKKVTLESADTEEHLSGLTEKLSHENICVCTQAGERRGSSREVK